MEQRNIQVDGNIFPCPGTATVDLAENKIRSVYLLAGGGLQDQNGALVDGAALISTAVGNLSFVGGQPMQQGMFPHDFIMFIYVVFYFILLVI